MTESFHPDLGFWRRVRLIPFNVQIAENERDRSLQEKLRCELPGILNWAVRGCLSWQRDGLERRAAPAPPTLAEIVGNDFPVLHVTCAISAVDEKCQTKLDLRCTDRCDREPMKIWNVKKLIMETRPSGKIEAQGLGIAAVSDILLQQRAQDLAEQDGRTGPTDADRAHALRELSSPIANRAPEVPPGDENLTIWNQSPDLTGHIVPNVLPDDEADLSAELTKEGVEEADQDRRRAAKDEDPPRPD